MVFWKLYLKGLEMFFGILSAVSRVLKLKVLKSLIYDSFNESLGM